MELAKNLLQKNGFTDIEKRPDGTYSATKDNTRYIGLYIDNISLGESESVLDYMSDVLQITTPWSR